MTRHRSLTAAGQAQRMGARWALLSLLVLSACADYDIDLSEEAAARVRGQDLGGLPYHPIVYHLDLSILIYQLYTQSLVWPFDPYYEELSAAGDAARRAFMGRVRQWADGVGRRQVAAGAGIEGYRGPGRLAGFADNPAHDPIVYQYGRVYPWASALAKPDQNWVEYLTPQSITERIAEVHICYRAAGGSAGDVRREVLPVEGLPMAPDARDVLLLAEGGTGDKGEPGQPASQSLMALALLRADADDAYDVHIAFRGSRSGDGARAASEALSTEAARGNPDWITDLGYHEVFAPHVSSLGEVSRGMATSIASIFPQLLMCLDQVAGGRRVAPTRIFVTGHSLGGGLAQHFTSALLLGTSFGPGGTDLPASLTRWPWAQLKLITFGAPRVGNAEWARTLTQDALDSEPYTYVPFSPWDGKAIGITHPDILPRLLDADRPAGYRVLIHTDPITSGVVQGGEHVGKTVYLDKPELGDEMDLLSTSSHEPKTLRARMRAVLRDDRIPERAWETHDIAHFAPDRVPENAGSEAEYQKLLDAVVNYHALRGEGFGVAALASAFDTFLSLLPE